MTRFRPETKANVLAHVLAIATLTFIAFIALGYVRPAHAATVNLLNVSYDPTRELYQAINAAFAKQWQAKTGGDVQVQQSHGDESILAEPSVAVVDKVVDGKGTRAVAEAYLQFRHTSEAQAIVAANFYRPRNKDVPTAIKTTLPTEKLFTIEKKFGAWAKAQAKHFNDGGIFEQIYQN